MNHKPTGLSTPTKPKEAFHNFKKDQNRTNDIILGLVGILKL